jgi:hypothetical protein
MSYIFEVDLVSVISDETWKKNYIFNMFMHLNKIIQKEIQKFGLKLKLSRCQKVKKE